MCDFIVDILPAWVAPNLITVWGFAWNVACLALTLALYGNSTDGVYDSRLAFFCGVSYFIYTTADNCDGKQARKNGTGSVMGMLFDHGLDATTAIVMNVVLCRMIQVGSGLPALFAIQISTVPFYALTMEEYYIGMLNLPMFSGPDDTSVLISAVCFITAYLGSGDIFTEHIDVPFGIAEYLGMETKSFRRVTYAVFAVYILEVAVIFAGSM